MELVNTFHFFLSEIINFLQKTKKRRLFIDIILYIRN